MSPTLALTAVTVPLIGARSTVSVTALASAATVALSCTTCARACETAAGSTAPSTFACAVETACSCCCTVSCCCDTVRWALVMASRSLVHDDVAVVNVCTRPELVPFAFFATTRKT